MVYDYEVSWGTRNPPKRTDFCYHELAFRRYETARKMGLDINFVAPGASLAGYSTVHQKGRPSLKTSAMEGTHPTSRHCFKV